LRRKEGALEGVKEMDKVLAFRFFDKAGIFAFLAF
jgi:hypothetical protein